MTSTSTPTAARCWSAMTSCSIASSRLSIDIYQHAAAYALERGLIIADTKFEFGIDAGGRLVLGDEVLTPDSSRFWPADDYQPGRPQAVVRQAVPARLAGGPATGTSKHPAPELPDEIVAGTRARYVDAYERLTGEPFSDYLRRNGVPPP